MKSQNIRAQSDTHPRVGALIRAKRRQSQRTLQALADEAGISVGYLSQVERDQATPSLGTLAAISRAFGVGFDYFISAPKARDALTRNGLRPQFSIDGSSVIYERIGAEFAGGELSSFIISIPPGYRSETVTHDGEEILYLLEGVVTQRVDGEEIVLRAGDSLHFRGNSPHCWWNDTDAVVRLLWCGTSSALNSNV